VKIAVISDIHSNLEALTSALHHIDGEAIERVVCLGDIVGYGANPNECVDLIRERCTIVVRGNHDAAVVDPRITDDFSRNARSVVHWTCGRLTKTNLEFLSLLPLTAALPDVCLVHASPCEPQQWRYIVDSWEARQAFRCFTEKLCFVGHSHIPGIYSVKGREQSIRRTEQYVINVGSVGQPRDRNPMLSFGILDLDEWSYRNVRLPYDVAGAAAKILNEGLPASLAQRLTLGI
jgi:predicted phosphodiesterase